MRRGLLKFQIGKNGLTPGLIETLKTAFKKNKIIRVQVLKSAEKEREKLEETAQKIIAELGKKHAYKTIGHTIILLKR